MQRRVAFAAAAAATSSALLWWQPQPTLSLQSTARCDARFSTLGEEADASGGERVQRWLKSWQADVRRFHKKDVNDLLTANYVRWSATHGQRARVLVPLCGKAKDMAWLEALGHEVVGVEGSCRR